MRDLLIAGGGPVGLATALYAARAGLDVAVREPRAGSIDKACGEGLMPGALAALRDLGVDPAGHELRGIRYVDRSREVEAAFRHGPGRGVRRTVLHDALRAAVDAAGVPVEQRPVRTVGLRADHVSVDGEPVRHLVAADGLHSPLRRMLGLDVTATTTRRYGLRCHVDVAPWTAFVEVHWSPVGEAYVTPVADDRVGVAVLSTVRRPLPDLLSSFPRLLAHLDDAPVGAVRGAGPLRQRARRRVVGRVLLVGDAAGYVDALTGEGIAVGLAQARAAVEAVRSGRPAGYEAAWQRITRRHDLMTASLLAATRRPALRRRIVPAAAALPRAFDAAVNALASPA
ncbi:NAD(P)/FAD-dependent oxidoreductase [Nocardioides iriomotensis]|uniref:NAD(P)/FAD-dependent oxidoreductase n=1 Tax=Nocardioides iriomotensis TaxID=715784 RepID=A0A4Q5IY38_9ACTN|nr:NAD(P)/FAD-dependent oxidoreductase [Nocardioides iriomotensis]RYU10138.1 NAD(P)/FAD-dependent oxidoreductase [Nocardioides iriomotensis]